MSPTPHHVEEWLPAVTRIVGIILGIALVIATIIGKAGIDFAGAYVFVTGMILYKSVHDFRGTKNVDEERWSHLD